MRPIKFRAWDTQEKRMIEGGCLDPGERKIWLSIGFEGEIVARTEEWGPEDRWSIEKQVDIKPDRIILDQFTGLHDKNGREIYEGDIVKRFDWNQSTLEPVIFDGGGFEPFRGKGSENVSPGMVEVIGNIHENPELLK